MDQEEDVLVRKQGGRLTGPEVYSPGWMWTCQSMDKEPGGRWAHWARGRTMDQEADAAGREGDEEVDTPGWRQTRGAMCNEADL